MAKTEISAPARDTTYLHPATDFGIRFHYRPPKTVASRRLTIVMLLTFLMMVGEIIGGFLTHSLALLSDASHMLTHLAALGIALAAIKISQRPISTQKTYGYYRFEILGAFVNGLTLFAIIAYILYEAVKKLITPQPIEAFAMFIVATAGLAVNLGSAFLLRTSRKDDLNVQGAWFHLLSDTFSSVAIIIGGIVILKTSWYWIDPVLSVVIAVVIAIWGIGLLRESTRVLLEATPRQVDIAAIAEAIREVSGVRAVHDIHVWALSSNMYAMTGHITVDNIPVAETQEILASVNRMLEEKFKIGHTNFQFEALNL
jgi:cobalt-zinc-cadmium efflux system protein